MDSQLQPVQDSADALAALRAIYLSKFSQLPPPIDSYHDFMDSEFFEEFLEDNRSDHRSVIDSKAIGRQAFLLDEQIRLDADGRVLRPPLAPVDDTQPLRESSASVVRVQERRSATTPQVSYKTADEGLKDEAEYEENCRARSIPTRLALDPKGGIMRVDYIGPLCYGIRSNGNAHTPCASDAAGNLEEMYHQFIKDEECCELGGWLNGS